MPLEHIVLVVVVQAQHAVLVGRDVGPHRPLEVLGLYRIALKLYLHTLVGHVAHIGGIACITLGQRHLDRAQHVGGLAVEVLDASAQTAAEKLELDTGIDIGHRLPSDVLVAHALQHEANVVALTLVDGVGVGIEEV